MPKRQQSLLSFEIATSCTLENVGPTMPFLPHFLRSLQCPLPVCINTAIGSWFIHSQPSLAKHTIRIRKGKKGRENRNLKQGSLGNDAKGDKRRSLWVLLKLLPISLLWLLIRWESSIFLIGILSSWQSFCLCCLNFMFCVSWFGFPLWG